MLMVQCIISVLAEKYISYTNLVNNNKMKTCKFFFLFLFNVLNLFFYVKFFVLYEKYIWQNE